MERAQRPPVIANDARAMFVGLTDSGKSKLMRHGVFDVVPMHMQRLLVDVNGEDHVVDDGHGVSFAHGDPSKLDWSKRTLHYVPGDPDDDADDGEYGQLLQLVWKHHTIVDGPGITVLFHETYGPTHGQKAPRALKRALKQGRKYNQRMLYAMQRPVDVLTDLRNQAGHIIIMAQPLDTNDEVYLGRTLGFKPGRLNAALMDLAARYKTSDDPEEDLGKFAHLHWVRSTPRLLYARPPLPLG